MQRMDTGKLMVANATLLSGIYLLLGLGVEVGRRMTNARWAERLSLALDALPARVLELTQLLSVVRAGYTDGKLSEFWVRVIFGTTTIAVIFVMALLVGTVMWAIRGLVLRRKSKGRARA